MEETVSILPKSPFLFMNSFRMIWVCQKFTRSHSLPLDPHPDPNMPKDHFY